VKTKNRVVYIVGLDLGKAQDPSALAVNQMLGAKPARIVTGHLWRWPLRTPYQQIAEDVLEITHKLNRKHNHRAWAANASPDPEPVEVELHLVVDATGVGVPVVEMMEDEGLQPISLYIISGYEVTRAGRSFHVPKRDLVSNLQLLLQSKRLRIIETLEHSEVLRDELLTSASR